MALLIILLIAFGLILGFFTREQAFRKLGRVLIMAALTPFFISFFKTYLSQLPLLEKVLFIIVIGIVGIFIILRLIFGKDVLANIAGNFLYDGLKAVLAFPFKMMGRLIKNYK
ncbi:MAG: hypothetical protein AB1480_15535 [Nitrospirota bacterium]